MHLYSNLIRHLLAIDKIELAKKFKINTTNMFNTACIIIIIIIEKPSIIHGVCVCVFVCVLHMYVCEWVTWLLHARPYAAEWGNKTLVLYKP